MEPSRVTSNDPEPGGVARIKGDPQILVHNLKYGYQMLLRVTLDYRNDEQCLVVKGGDSLYEPIWPRGTKPLSSDQRPGVDVPQFGHILTGDSFKAGGGIWSVDGERPQAIALLPSCRNIDGFMIFNSRGFERR